MPRFFAGFIAKGASPGVIVGRQKLAVANVLAMAATTLAVAFWLSRLESPEPR